MALVKIKEKYQTLVPKSVIERELEIALQEVSQGKVSPAYSSAKAFLRSLHRQAKKLTTP